MSKDNNGSIPFHLAPGTPSSNPPVGRRWGRGKEKESATFPLTLPIAAATLTTTLTAALAAALPHSPAGATSRAHAGLRTYLLILGLKLISQGSDSLLLGLILVLIGDGALPQRRPTTPLAAPPAHARLSPACGSNEKAESADHCYYGADFLHNFIL